jgi:hypothetical protein
VIIPPEELAGFHAQDPVWNGDLDAGALTDRDKATLREFWTTLDNDRMEYCTRCQECWFQMKIDSDGICERCYRQDRKRRPDEPYFFSADNQLDFGPVPARLPQLRPTEESLLARVHVHVNIMLVRGQQYKYRGHVVHFLREVGLVYNQLPLLPQELNTVLLRPANTSSQFPLIVCYALTVHKSQSITEDMIVTDLSCRDFQTGLSYVAVSRVKTLEGLMLDAPFDRNRLIYESPPDGMKMKMRDQELSRRQVLTRNPYKIHNTKNG